jgi:6-phosphogluconolactonase
MPMTNTGWVHGLKTTLIALKKYTCCWVMSTAPRTLVWLRAAVAGLLFTVLAGCSTLSLNSPPPDVTPRYAYVTDSAAGQVLGYTVNSSTGALTPLGSFAVNTGPSSIGGDATGAIVYVANADGTVSGFIVNAGTGALQPVAGTFIAGTRPISIAVDPHDRFVYVANAGSNDVSGFHETAATGVLTPLTSSFPLSGTPSRIIIDPSGRFVYVTEGAGTAVFIINADASLTLQQTVPPANTAATAIAVEPHLHFAYITDNQTGVTAYAVESSTGKLTAISGATFASGTAPVAVVADPTGSFLYVANSGSGDIAAFVINSNGFLTPAGARQSLASAPVDLATDPSGKFVFALSPSGVTGFAIGSGGGLSPAGTTTAGTNPSAVTVLP